VKNIVADALRRRGKIEGNTCTRGEREGGVGRQLAGLDAEGGRWCNGAQHRRRSPSWHGYWRRWKSLGHHGSGNSVLTGSLGGGN
jgi:hypothetical protein